MILSTGRYSREKAQWVLIDAVARVPSQGPNSADFGGRAPNRRRSSAGQQARILPPIYGFYSRQDLIRIINLADLYVHPAEIETSHRMSGGHCLRQGYR